MRLGGEAIGRWGIVLLAVTGLAGLLLGWHGWTGRHSLVSPPLAAGNSASSPPGATAGPPASAAGPPSPAASTAAASPASSGPARPGPPLKSEPYASVAFQVWPGPMSAAARQAMTGLTISVHRQGSALSITAGVAGQQAGSARLYPRGARVYVVEATLGDDSGGSDYNLGDDGLVVTDSQGRIVQ